MQMDVRIQPYTSVNDLGGPSVTADSTDVLCNGGNTGTATATASGGTPVVIHIYGVIIKLLKQQLV